MKYFALFYDVVEDFVSRRSAHREEHLRRAREANRRGELVLAGALTEPADRALLVFRAADRSVVEEFARNDPYVTSGLVTRWEVRSWAVVIGDDALDASPKAGYDDRSCLVGARYTRSSSRLHRAPEKPGIAETQSSRWICRGFALR